MENSDILEKASGKTEKWLENKRECQKIYIIDAEA